jgi:DNA-binding transcriptional LysR family regulator
VARLRHSGRAADKLCITASAISHRIRQLEAHVASSCSAATTST